MSVYCKKIVVLTLLLSFICSVMNPNYALALRPISAAKSEEKSQLDMTRQSRIFDTTMDEIKKLITPLIIKIHEMDYDDSPRTGFILEREEFGVLLKNIAERLLSFYENAKLDRYDDRIKSIISLLINKGFSDRAIIEIIGKGKVWPAPSAGIIDVAISLERERLAQDVGPGVMSLIKRTVKNKAKILEIGPGEGDLIKGLIDWGILPLEHENIMQAIDMDDEAIAKAREKGIKVIKKNAATLDRSFGTFHMVLIAYPETFDMRVFYDIFMGALRVLEPGGLLVILTKDTAAMDNHFYTIRNVIKHSKKLLTEEIPYTEWKPQFTYEYIVVRELPILFSGEDIEDIIKATRELSKQDTTKEVAPLVDDKLRDTFDTVKEIQSSA